MDVRNVLIILVVDVGINPATPARDAANNPPRGKGVKKVRKKVSWLRMLQDIDETMNTAGLTEYQVPVETTWEAQVDGGYPTMESMDDVAARFNLQVEWVRWGLIDEISLPFPKVTIRRITARK